jgi:hypothetical protein
MQCKHGKVKKAGRGGTLVRPLGRLPAPAAPEPMATPYSFTPRPVTAVPSITPGQRVGSIGTAANTVPASVYGDVLSGGTPAEQAAALRQAQLGSTGNTVPRGQFASPEIISPPLNGQAKWAQLGEAKLLDHIARDINPTLTPKDIAALKSTVRGKSMLIQASDLSPGSAAMKSLTKQIQTVLGKEAKK